MTRPRLATAAEADTLVTSLQQRDSAILSGRGEGGAKQEIPGDASERRDRIGQPSGCGQGGSAHERGAIGRLDAEIPDPEFSQ